MDLSLLAVDQVMNCIVAAGYAVDEEVGYVYCTLSDDNGDTWTADVQVAAADEEQPSVRILATGEILVALTAGGVCETYLSRDYNTTWVRIGAV